MVYTEKNWPFQELEKNQHVMWRGEAAHASNMFSYITNKHYVNSTKWG